MLPHKERLLRSIENSIDEIHKINPDKWIRSEIIASIYSAITHHAEYSIGIDLGAKTISMIAGDNGLEISKTLLSYPAFVLNLSRLFQKINAFLGIEFDTLKWDDLYNVLILTLTQEAEKKIGRIKGLDNFITSFFSGSKFERNLCGNIESTLLTRYIFSVQAYTLTHKFAYTYFLSLIDFLKLQQEFVFSNFTSHLNDTYFTKYDKIIEYSNLVKKSYIESFNKTNDNSVEAITNYLKKDLEEEIAYLQYLHYYDRAEMTRLISSHINYNSFNSTVIAYEIEPVMFELQKMELSMRHLVKIANLLCRSNVIMGLWEQLIYNAQKRNTNVYDSVDEVFDYYSQILRLKCIPEYLLINKELTPIQLDGCIQSFDAIIDTLAIILPEGIVTKSSKIRSYQFFLLCNLTFEVIKTHHNRIPLFKEIKGLIATCLASSLIILTNSLLNSPLSEYSIKKVQQLSHNNDLYISDLIVYGFEELKPILQSNGQISGQYIGLILISFSKFWSQCLKSLLKDDSSKYTIESLSELIKEYNPVTSVEYYINLFSKYFS